MYFAWPTPSGTKRTRVYTSANGTAHLYGPVGSLPVYQQAKVGLEANRGELASASFMPTPPLISGLSGWSVKLSDRRPAPESSLQATAIGRDISGRPAAGLRTVFTWKIGGRAERFVTETDRQGIARCPIDVGNARVGEPVYVRGETEAAGRTRANMPYFVISAQ